MEYNLFSLRDHKVTPYVFVGAAVYHFNPYAYDTTGKKVYLQPLSTTGEGLPQYPGVKEYSLTQFAIPIGGGIKFRISDKVVLAYEIGLRKLFTYYLDDVGGRYVDQNILLAARGPEAVEMAYRGNQLEGGAAVSARGNVSRQHKSGRLVLLLRHPGHHRVQRPPDAGTPPPSLYPRLPPKSY